MKKRLLLFGLILCLILVSGFGGREFPFRSTDGGDYYYQSAHSANGTGMCSAPVSDKAIWLSGNETGSGRETEQKRMSVPLEAPMSFDRVFNAENKEEIVPLLWDNDQLNLIAMAPRA